MKLENALVRSKFLKPRFTSVTQFMMTRTSLEHVLPLSTLILMMKRIELRWSALVELLQPVQPLHWSFGYTVGCFTPACPGFQNSITCSDQLLSGFKYFIEWNLQDIRGEAKHLETLFFITTRTVIPFFLSQLLNINYKDGKDPMEWWEYYESEHQEIAKLELIWNNFSRCSWSC